MEPNYKGLANIGATCYMNSLLQTLFMTPEFRQAVYQWQYNDRLHPKPSDSILFQLQRLFGKLQKGFPGAIDTRDLVKSFQWEDEQAQMQQDIQQFNRVLFQALEKSLVSKKMIMQKQTETHFVRDLYEGQMIHFTHCKQCNNQSQRQEIFQDLLLTVKNPYQRIYNNCVDLALQRYMKPELLDQNNLYFCERCQKKVVAQRGMRFLKMPKLLNVILRRFDFDYFTMQRIKVNDRVEFPYVLNFNNYMQGYDNIQNKLNEDSSAYFLDRDIAPKKKVSSTTTNASKVTTNKKPLVTNIVGKKTTKPSSNTKSFLQQMRKKKMQSQTYEQNQDLIFVSGTATSPANTQPTSSQNNIQQTQKKQSLRQIKQDKQTEQNVQSEQKTNDKKSEQTISRKQEEIIVDKKDVNNQILVPPPLNLPPPTLSTPYSTNISDLSLEQQLAKKTEEREKLQKEKREKNRAAMQQNRKKALQFLKEGHLVYELYAVLVHSGSAGHGHYYSYIKSFEDQNWYCFNDERVTEINVEQLQKSFGGSGFANAYALYYRQVEQIEQKKDIVIPKYIQSAIQQEIINYKQRQRQKIQNLQNILVIKIHYQLLVKQLQVHKGTSMLTCLRQAREMFDIHEEVPLKNSRLRMFNPISDVKLDTYTGKEQMSMEQLKISSYRSFLLEIKKEQEVFEQYIAGQMNIRIVLWQQCGGKISSLDEAFLTVHKVSINRNSQMKEVEKAICKKRSEILKQIGKQSENQNICVVKRHQNDEYSYHQIINVFDYKQKTVDELMVIENEILFIESDADTLKWPQEFEDEVYRITIKYFSSQNGSTQTYLTDSRKTLETLKQQLCKLSEMDPEETILRRGTKSGMELKDLKTTMKDSRFITGTQVYLDKGLPAKPGEVRIQLFFAYDADKDLYNRLHEFEYIVDVPINGQWKASQVKSIFVKIVKKYRDMDLKEDDFRIRQKVSDKIGKIYRERPMKEQQLIEKREIAIQFKPDRIDFKDFKDFSVYVRIWNPQEWTLSEKEEFIVNKNTSMQEFASMIYQKDKEVPAEEMQVCRILSIHKFNILDLCQMEYFQMTDASVIGEPLFVNADGLLFIVKSSKKQPVGLTAEQQCKFGGKIKPNMKIRARKPVTGVKKQKGVSIRVVEKQDQQSEQKNI